MRIAACSGVALCSTLISSQALAQAPAAPPPGGAPGYGAPLYGQPPPPPPGYYYAPVPQQEPTQRTAFNNFFVELLGPAILYSVNYERIFSDLSLRLGIGYFSVSASDSTSSGHAYFLTVPADLNYLGIGSKKHIFEVGGGATLLAVGAGASTPGVSSSDSGVLIYGHLNLGYRLQPPNGGFMLRAGISPLIGSGGFLPWPYVSLGAAL